MTDTHITTDELVFIEAYFHQEIPISQIAKLIGRARQTVHNVIAYLRGGHTALDYYQRYQENKKRCGRKRIVLPTDQQKHVEKQVAQGWTLGVIVGRQEMSIDYSAFNDEFGHLEGDTIGGIRHKSAVITLVEHLSKAIITLKPKGRTAQDIESAINT